MTDNSKWISFILYSIVNIAAELMLVSLKCINEKIWHDFFINIW